MGYKLTFPVDEESFVRRWMEIVQNGDEAEELRARETVHAINRAYQKGCEDVRKRDMQ